MGLLVDPRVDDLGLLGLERSFLLRSQVGDLPVRVVCPRGLAKVAVAPGLELILLSSYVGRSSGILLAQIRGALLAHRMLPLDWLGRLSYSKRFHLFPKQTIMLTLFLLSFRPLPKHVTAECSAQTLRVSESVYLPGLRRLLENFTLHLLEDRVDVLKVWHRQLLDRTYTQPLM